MRLAILACLALAPLAVAQTPVSISPKAAATTLGNSNNSLPFSWTPNAYQQVHSQSSFTTGGPAAITRMRLRMGRGFTNRSGATVDLEVRMADCPHASTAATAVLASNIVAGSEVVVVKRKMVNFPQVPNNDWVIPPFAFDSPFPWKGGHLSWRASVFGNSRNTRFIYPLDAFWSVGSVTNNGPSTGCRSATATANARLLVTMFAPGQTSTIRAWSYVAAGGLPTFITLGASATQWGPITLPFDLTALGAPGCFIRNDILTTLPGRTVAGTRGEARITLNVPNDQNLSGQSFLTQGVFLQPAANAFGVFTTNGTRNTIGTDPGLTRIFAVGNPNATRGTLAKGFGLAIGFN